MLLRLMQSSKFTRACREAKSEVALASTKATSGGFPPAICVVSFWLALSALTFSNLMVMFGWSLWKSAANFFIVGSPPTHEENVTVTGDVGSLTGPSPLPALVFGASPLEQATSAPDRARTATSCAFLETL